MTELSHLDGVSAPEVTSHGCPSVETDVAGAGLTVETEIHSLFGCDYYYDVLDQEIQSCLSFTSLVCLFMTINTVLIPQHRRCRPLLFKLNYNIRLLIKFTFFLLYTEARILLFHIE